MALDPSTLQQLAQNNLQQPAPYKPPDPYKPYQPTPAPTLPDATQPLIQRQQQLQGLMADPGSDPRYRATEDLTWQASNAQKERAQENLKGAADPLAVQRELEKYDQSTKQLLAQEAANLYGQSNQELGTLAVQQSGALQNQAQLAQQASQFGQQLGEQSSQFGYGQQAQQGQFGTTSGLQGQQIANQAQQFQQSLAQQQSQFDTTSGFTKTQLDQAQQRIDTQKTQFDVQTGLTQQGLTQGQERIAAQEQQYAQTLAEDQRQFNANRSGPSASAIGSNLANSALQSIVGTGVAAPIGQALGGLMNGLFGNSSAGNTTVPSAFTSTPTPLTSFGGSGYTPAPDAYQLPPVSFADQGGYSAGGNSYQLPPLDLVGASGSPGDYRLSLGSMSSPFPDYQSNTDLPNLMFAPSQDSIFTSTPTPSLSFSSSASTLASPMSYTAPQVSAPMFAPTPAPPAQVNFPTVSTSFDLFDTSTWDFSFLGDLFSW